MVKGIMWRHSLGIAAMASMAAVSKGTSLRRDSNSGVRPRHTNHHRPPNCLSFCIRLAVAFKPKARFH